MSTREIVPGTELPTLIPPPVSRLTLALYAGASGDHNPIHVDPDFAREHGLDDVIAHGMLAAAYLGRVLTNWVPQAAIHSFNVRFAGMMHVHDQLTCRGTVTEIMDQDGESLARVELTATSADGTVKVTGEAVIATSHLES